MSFTQGQIDALKAQVAQGVQSVRYNDGKEIQYIPLAEALKLIAKMEREVNSATGSGRQTRFNPTYTRGT
jgi:hypothetical protein